MTARTPTVPAAGALRGLGPLLRLLLRRFRFRIACWVLPIVALVAVTVPSYAGAYPNLTSRGPLVAQLRSGRATEILYGKLPLPGTLGQLAQWEVGTYVVLLTAVMALLLVVAMTRGDEDRGRTELVATAGVGRWAPTVAAAVLAVGVFVVLGGGVGGALALSALSTSEITAAGAWLFGAVIAVTGIGVAASTLLISELCWDAASARTAAWSFLAVEFALRVCADLTDTAPLRAVSWFGIKDLVAPFTYDRVWPVLLGPVVAVVLFGAALAVRSRREFGAGLLRAPEPRPRRLRVSGPLDLAWRLGRTRLALWAIPTVALAALFGGMSRSLIELIAHDATTADLVASMGAAGDPVKQFFGFSYLFVALLPMVYGVLTVLGGGAAEHAGLLDAELTVGTPRTAPLRSRILLGAGGGLALLLLAAAVQALLAWLLVDADAARWALSFPLAQAPGLLVAVGLAGLLLGAAPRWAGAVWAVVGWSAFAVLFGDLVKLPTGARRVSLFGHGPDAVVGAVADRMPWGAVLVLLVAAVVAALAGLARMRRRDVLLG